jgi:hypothetical protein
MVDLVDVVVVLSAWNMIISLHFLVAVRMMHQIFNCFVKNAIEVNQIAVIARYMTRK